MTFTGLLILGLGFALLTLAGIPMVRRKMRGLIEPTARPATTQSSNYKWWAFSAVAIGTFISVASHGSIFGSPNQSSVFSAAERQRHGIVSALLSLVRNSANITSIALATAIVTATMASMGFPPSLEDISGAPHAFIAGLRMAFLAMVALLVVGMVISYLKGGQVEELPAPVPRTRISGSAAD